MQNLTEFNTAHNRRISMLGIADDDNSVKNAPGVKRKKRSITFNDEEEVINPEDIDPNVGRFRNLVHTSLVIPTKVNIAQSNELSENTKTNFYSFTSSSELKVKLQTVECPRLGTTSFTVLYHRHQVEVKDFMEACPPKWANPLNSTINPLLPDCSPLPSPQNWDCH